MGMLRKTGWTRSEKFWIENSQRSDARESRLAESTPGLPGRPIRLHDCRPSLIDNMADIPYSSCLNWGGASNSVVTPHVSSSRARHKFLALPGPSGKPTMMWTGECTMSYATDRILSDFGKSAMALAERLEEDPRFGLIEQVFIENHMPIIQSAYSSWKRRHLHKDSVE